MRTFQFRLYDEDHLLVNSWSAQYASTEEAIQVLEDHVRYRCSWTSNCSYGRLFIESCTQVCRVSDKETLMLEGVPYD